MSFLGDAFAIPPAKKTTETAAASAAASVPAAAAAAVAAPSEAVTAEDSATRSTDPAIQAANQKMMLTPPVPGGATTEGALPPLELMPADGAQAGPVVVVTAKAASEFRRILDEQKLPAETGLRLGVLGGGCSGFSYKLGFETVKAPLDWEGESNGVKIYIDPKSFLYLAGIELDFQDSLMGRGFVFNNPNAKKTCGCGESFQV